MIIDELIAILGYDVQGEGELRRFNDGLTQAERKAQAVANRINAMSVAIGTFVGHLAIDLARGIGRTIGSLPGDVLAVGKEFENLGIRFETLEGSAERGKEALEWVREFAVQTPLDLAQAANAYARLKNFGIDPTNGSLLAMVDAMAASGQGLQMLERLTLATGQAWAKGKLQGEEILQLVEAGVPVWEMLEKATGKSAAELQKLSSAGKLGRDVIQQLIDEIGKKYVGASEKMAKTLDGIQDKITEAWTNFKKEVADQGFYDEFKRRTQDVLDTLDRWDRSGVLTRLARGMSNFLTGSMRFGSQAGKALWDIGRAAYYTADALVTLVSRVTGLNKAASAGILGAALLGSTRMGRGLMMALARRVPQIAALLLVEDILSGLRGDDSYIGNLEGGQEALEKLRSSAQEYADALDRLYDSISNLLDVDLSGFSWGSFVDREIIGFVRELGTEIQNLADSLDALSRGDIWGYVRGLFNIEFTPGGLAERVFGPDVAPPAESPAPEVPTEIERENGSPSRRRAGSGNWFLDRLNEWTNGRFEESPAAGGKENRIRQPVQTRFEQGIPQVHGRDELRIALENFRGNMAKMSPDVATEAVLNDNSVANDNRDQSVTVGGSNVTVNVQQATQAPAAAGKAVGDAVSRGAMNAVRSNAVTGTTGVAP